MSRSVQVQRPGFFKRILSIGKPVGVARAFAKSYIIAKGSLPRVLKARYPEWPHERVEGFCSQYPNIYDLTCCIISIEWNLKISEIEDTHPEVVSSVLVGFSEIGLFNYLEANGELDNLIGSSQLGKDVVYHLLLFMRKRWGYCEENLPSFSNYIFFILDHFCQCISYPKCCG